MPTYKLKIRQPGQWFFRTFKLKGQVKPDHSDRLMLELTNGTYREIPNISQCEITFGSDLIEARKQLQKKQEEEKANVNVPGAQSQDNV